MATNDSPQEEPRSISTAKKPYVKPGFRYEQVFVTTALGCGKISPSDFGCSSSTKS
jgi:hypothetical protein